MNQHHIETNFTNDHLNILSCKFGVIAVNPNYTKFGLIPEKKKIEELSFSLSETCTNYTSFLISLEPCFGNNYCEIKFDKGWIKNSNLCFERVKNGSRGIVSWHCKNALLSVLWNKEASVIRIYSFNFAVVATFIFFYVYFVWA